jgi:DNA-directed RNA polymerase specialized sigma24 family protein
MWNNRRRYDADKASLWTWALAIFTNTAADHLKKPAVQSRFLERPLDSDGSAQPGRNGKRRSPYLKASNPLTAKPTDCQGGSERRREPSDKAKALTEVLNGLDETDRDIFIASLRTDVKYWAAELAKEFAKRGIRMEPAYIRVRASRIRKMIKSEMEKRGFAVPEGMENGNEAEPPSSPENGGSQEGGMP